jgi:hypothetical protein
MTTRATGQAIPTSPTVRPGGQIDWPEQFSPAKAQVFVHNEILIAAPPERWEPRSKERNTPPP